MEHPSQLPMLRQLLIHRERDRHADVQAARMNGEQALGADGDVKDFKDDAEAMQRLQTDDFQLERDLAELRDIEAALRRIDAGTYGECADCGEAIPLERLKSQPAALRCAPCQSQHEQRR